MKNFIPLLLILCFSIHLNAQIVVEGIVHYDSIPLESANVIIKNTTKGTATGKKGDFKIETKIGDTLSFSYLGYKTKDVVVDETKIINVSLEVDSLDEVLVIGYETKTTCSSTICCSYYAVEVEDENSEIESLVKLFPNPSSSGMFQLKFLEKYNEMKISVANMAGQIILNKEYKKFGNQISIDLYQFSRGIYIVNIIADGERLKAIKAVRD